MLEMGLLFLILAGVFGLFMACAIGANDGNVGRGWRRTARPQSG
jgi:hypothetical protein